MSEALEKRADKIRRLFVEIKTDAASKPIWRFTLFSRWRAVGVFIYSLLAFGFQYHVQPDICFTLLGPFVVIAGMLSGFLQFIYPGKFMYALGAAVLVFIQAYLFLSILSFLFASMRATTHIAMRLFRNSP